VPNRKLMAKEIDAFVVANLIKPQPQRKLLSEKLQRRLLQPDEKLWACQQHPGRLLPSAAPDRGADLPQLLVGKPLGFVEYEERGIRLGRVRYCHRPPACRQLRQNGVGAGHLLAC
jgi:hypothetical protein